MKVFNKEKYLAHPSLESCIGVEFDKFIDGHDCCKAGKMGYCWNCERDTLVREKSTGRYTMRNSGDAGCASPRRRKWRICRGRNEHA